MNEKNFIAENLSDHIAVAQAMEGIADQIAGAVVRVTGTFLSNRKVLLAGNGGSAADAQHWAAEWVIRLTHNLKRPGMPALALTTDTSILTAGANDIGYDNVFARQVEALGAEGDLLVIISTSGNSENLKRAAETAKQKGLHILGILGKDGGILAPHCDWSVIIPSNNTQRIQEMHSFVGHILCEASEKALYENA